MIIQNQCCQLTGINCGPKGRGDNCIVGANHSPVSCSVECDKYEWCNSYTINRDNGECRLESSCGISAIDDCTNSDRYIKNVATSNFSIYHVA